MQLICILILESMDDLEKRLGGSDLLGQQAAICLELESTSGGGSMSCSGAS